MRKPKILFVSPMFFEEDVIGIQHASVAGNKWKQGLLSEVAKMGVEVSILGHIPVRYFPYGRLWSSSRPSRSSGGLTGYYEAYLNFPFLRHPMLSVVYKRRVRKLREAGFIPDLVVGYNLLLEVHSTCRFAAKEFGVPWVTILADQDWPGDFWPEAKRRGRGCDGWVFLSARAYEEHTDTPKLHLDGGVPCLRFSPTVNSEDRQGAYRVAFQGGQKAISGIELLADAFRLLPKDRFVLDVSGRGLNPKIAALKAEGFAVNPRGLISEAELARMSREADVFVNPRPSSIAGNSYNYPSKLAEYLSWGKPVVSTMTPGVSAEYKEVVLVPETEDPRGIAEAIVKASALSRGKESLELRERMYSFMHTKKLWSVQAQRLLNWSRSIGANV
jgi:glycosyltransferase involved in cell wall biosynthesis